MAVVGETRVVRSGEAQRRGRTAIQLLSTFVLGTTKPTVLNTGCRIAREDLIVNVGDMIVTTPNAVISGYLITGRLLIRAANVTVRDCIVEAGGVPGGAAHLIDTSNVNQSNSLIEFCTVSSTNFPNNSINGIGPKSYIARRNNVFDVVDGFSAFDLTGGGTGDGLPHSDVVLEGNYIHGLLYIVPASHSDNRTHNDGIQIQGGCATVTIRGNNFYAYDSAVSMEYGVTFPNGDPDVGGRSLSAIMLNTDAARYASDVTITENWIYGGGYAINGTGTNGGTVTFNANKFGGDAHFGPFSICITLGTTWVLATSGPTANTYESSGLPIASSATYTVSGQTMRRYF